MQKRNTNSGTISWFQGSQNCLGRQHLRKTIWHHSRQPGQSKNCTKRPAWLPPLIAVERLKYIYVAARNADVSKRLEMSYPQLAGTGRANVYCVGNRDYEGQELTSPGAREIEESGSGIPDLRMLRHSLVAKAQFRTPNQFIESEIQNLIRSLDTSAI